MTNEPARRGGSASMASAPSLPPVVDQAVFRAELDQLRVREKAHTREGLALMDLSAYGRQESWEDSPAGWPQDRTNGRSTAGAPGWPPVPEWPAGRPIPQWPRLEAGHSDSLG